MQIYRDRPASIVSKRGNYNVRVKWPDMRIGCGLLSGKEHIYEPGHQADGRYSALALNGIAETMAIIIEANRHFT